IGELLPAFEEVDRLRDVGIPHGLGGFAEALDPCLPQPGDAGAAGAVNLNGQQIVAPHAGTPARIELAERAVLEAEDRVSRVVGGRLVWLSIFGDPLGDVGAAAGDQRLNRAKQVVDHVSPVAEHVDNDSAAVFLAVIPAWALRGLVLNLSAEDPVAELAADGENFAKEFLLAEHADLPHPREPKLVLDDAVFQARAFAEPCQAQGFGGFDGGGFFAVNRLAGFDRHLHEGTSLKSSGGIEEYLVLL